MLRAELRGSPGLAFLTAAMHMAAAAALLAVLPLLPGLICAALLAGQAVILIRERALLGAPGSPAFLEGTAEGSLVLQLRDGTRLAGRAGARRHVSRWGVVLQLCLSDGGGRTLLLARDMLPPEAFRKLRLWALWSASPGRRVAESA